MDDEYSVRAATAFLLELEGYSVRTWQRGAHFLAAAPTEPAGCVILDLRMPDMDGLEVQRRLNEADLNFPVIMLTGHGDIAVTVAAMKMGAVDFLVKPFERAEPVAGGGECLVGTARQRCPPSADDAGASAGGEADPARA